MVTQTFTCIKRTGLVIKAMLKIEDLMLSEYKMKKKNNNNKRSIQVVLNVN